MTPPSSTYMSKETKRKSLVLHRLPQSQKPVSSMDLHCHLLASAGTHRECTCMPIHSHRTHSPHKLNLWASELVQIAAIPDNPLQSLGPAQGRKVILRLPHTHACKCTPNVTNVKQLGETRAQVKERRCGLTPNPHQTQATPLKKWEPRLSFNRVPQAAKRTGHQVVSQSKHARRFPSNPCLHLE